MILLKSRGKTIGVKPEAVAMVVPDVQGDIPRIGHSEMVVLGVGPVGVEESVEDVVKKVNDALLERKEGLVVNP